MSLNSFKFFEKHRVMEKHFMHWKADSVVAIINVKKIIIILHIYTVHVDR